MNRIYIAATIGVLFFGLMVGTQGARAADEPTGDLVAGAENPIHNELRQLRESLVEAVNKGDLDGIVSFCDANVSLTTPDGVVSKGTDAVRKYYESKTKGPNRVVESFSSKPTVDALSSLYFDNTAVATGTSVDHFKLTDGMEFDLNTRWSATLVKEGGKWLIANYHTSTNVFDNPLLNSAKQAMYWAGGGGLAAGVITSMLIMKFLRRRRI
jgi:ketosteroid isomerase-like protein